MQKIIKLSIEQAKELYNTNPELRNTILSDFTNKELDIVPILKDWENCIKSEKTYYYIGSDSTVRGYKAWLLKNISKSDIDIVPTEKHAKSMLAFAQLSVLMDELGDECNIDWSLEDIKYVITRRNNNILTDFWYNTYHFLTFKTKEVRDAFLEKHRKLIEEYYML